MQHVSATAQHDVSVITGGLQTSLYLSKKENCIQTQESEAERERRIKVGAPDHESVPGR